jgi:hypothetical protein
VQAPLKQYYAAHAVQVFLASKASSKAYLISCAYLIRIIV